VVKGDFHLRSEAVKKLEADRIKRIKERKKAWRQTAALIRELRNSGLDAKAIALKLWLSEGTVLTYERKDPYSRRYHKYDKKG
jgi:hypothetical protein